MAEQKGMAPKLRGMVPKTDNLLLKIEILAILLLVIVPNFTRESIIDFTRSSFLSLGISCYRQLIGTTSTLPPYYLWIFWLERAVSLYLLILYHRATKFWGIAFGLYLMSTVCSSSIVYFMPTRKWQGLPKNPSPRKTNKGEVLVKKVDILERLMFWLERLVGVVCIFFISRFARFSTVFFCFSDFIYLICFALRLEVNPLPVKPDYQFCIERLAIMILELDCTDQTPNSLFIARSLFFLTNSCYSFDSYTPAFMNKGLISKAYAPKLREVGKGLKPEKKKAKTEDEPQIGKFEVHQGDHNNWEKELVAKYRFMDHISESTCTKIEDESPKQKLEVHHQDENNSWEKELVAKYGCMEHMSEFKCTKTKDTAKYENEEEPSKDERYNWEEELDGFMEEHVSGFTCTKPNETKKSEIEEEAPIEENYRWPREEDLEVVEALKEENNKSLDEGNARCYKWKWSDDMSSDLPSPWDYFATYKDMDKVDDNWGKQLVMADQIDTVNGNGSSDPMDPTTAEYESNKEALLLEDTGEVERLRAENDNLKREKEALEREKEALEREKEALEDTLKAEILEHEDTLLEWKMHDQELDAMLVEAKMKSQALVEELDSHSKFEEQMLETLKAYKKDCTKWEQDNKDIGAKFEAVISAIRKDQQTLLTGQGHVCKCKAERKKWENEKITLNKQLEAANSWYEYYFEVATTANYWNQYYMQRENYYSIWLRYYEDNISSLVKSNSDLAKRIEVETSLSTSYHNHVFDYEERCRALEEDKNNLTAKLCAANASSELYRSMLRDLAT